ncbi:MULTISPECIES: fimbrial protein [Enterobacter]|uniref:fimbrial protein n=1 Tax=Enterobacter TaxID=547 RepID=UPI001F17CD9B|nr:fimbrial protein [Enterobacter roggenkampii]MCE5967231.1 type 1 fimbrial protein [Enterobacter roggenkampii]MCE5971663.1 type 1 fimbrial protein [Enterobacter roggenkampii]UHY24936.1 type 1 fimbrial protein [Enterobacter roggenkampii]HDS5356311.1 type 1 fimbrial protein [Enterobacter kobei]
MHSKTSRFQMLLIILMTTLVIQVSHASEQNNWLTNSLHGMFHVNGAVYRDACRLDMTSVFQEIDLGDTKTSQLNHPGDRGRATTLELRLKDCQQTSRSLMNVPGALLNWSDSQPLATIRFIANSHKDNDQLIALNGIEGIGLRITDHQGKSVPLGQRGGALFLEPGTDTLIYHVAPERTLSALEANEWDAFVSFELIYD